MYRYLLLMLMTMLTKSSSLLARRLAMTPLKHSILERRYMGSFTPQTTALHKVIFVLGGPGAGKGTQCTRLVEEFGLTHLSVGELLRKARNAGNESGKLIDEYIREGKIVPVALSLGLLREAMDSSVGSFFLVDGFPRNWDNVQGWDSLMQDAAQVECCLFLDCPEAEQEKRLLTRGETSGRSDDNIESARKRFKTYMEETMPVVEHFERIGKLRRVAAKLSPDEVYEQTRAAIYEFLPVA